MVAYSLMPCQGRCGVSACLGWGRRGWGLKHAPRWPILCLCLCAGAQSYEDGVESQPPIACREGRETSLTCEKSKGITGTRTCHRHAKMEVWLSSKPEYRTPTIPVPHPYIGLRSYVHTPRNVYICVCDPLPRSKAPTPLCRSLDSAENTLRLTANSATNTRRPNSSICGGGACVCVYVCVWWWWCVCAGGIGFRDGDAGKEYRAQALGSTAIELKLRGRGYT